MINKRLLIKNLLAQNDEVAFMTKAPVELHTHEGKTKFLKHICALSILTLLIILYCGRRRRSRQ
jgi:hypothetical protein